MGLLTWSYGDVIYLDAVTVIYSVDNIEPYSQLLYPLWSSAAAGQVRLVGSELLLLETLVKSIREGDATLERAYRHVLTHSDLELVPISRAILDQAAHIRAATRIQTPDAIHAATASVLNCTTFLTNDKGFLKVRDLRVRLLSEVAAA